MKELMKPFHEKSHKLLSHWSAPRLNCLGHEATAAGKAAGGPERIKNGVQKGMS